MGFGGGGGGGGFAICPRMHSFLCKPFPPCISFPLQEGEEEEAIRADPSQIITGSKKFQVFCSPEWRHLIGREPINHAFSRTPPPIQPLASLFQCVYYTAEHKGDTRLHMH